MAEDIEAGGEAEPEGGSEVAELAGAEEAFSRAAEAQGVGEGGEESDRGAEGVPTRETPSASQQPTAAQEARSREWAEQEWRRREIAAQDAHRHRQERKRAEEQSQQLAQVLERFGQTPRPGEGQQPVEDPEPDREENFWEWHAWDQRRLQRDLLSAFDERLTPLLERDRQLRELEEQQAHVRQQQEQRSGWYQENAEVARQAHKLYVQTEEGRDYMDRVSWLAGIPGDGQGPGSPGAFSLAFQAAGFPSAKSDQMGVAFLHGMQDWSTREGLNPAAAIDYFVRALVAAAGGFYGGGAPAQQQAAPPAKLPASQDRVREMKRAAGSGIAGSAAASGAAPQDLQGQIKALADSGRLDDLNAMKALCSRFKLTPAQLRKEIGRVEAGAA